MNNKIKKGDNNKMEVQVIEERELLDKQLRIYGDFDNPLFLARDVAEWLDYDLSKVGQLLANVDENEKLTLPIFYSGQVRNMWMDYMKLLC